MLEQARIEMSLAVRRLRKRPGRGVAGIVTLGLGITASTTAFSAVRAVLLEPLPVEDQDELVVFWLRSEARSFDHVPFLPSGLRTIERSEGIFQSVGAFETAGARPALGEAADGTFAIDHVRVGGDFFGTLGVTPRLGRTLRAEDDVVGAAAAVVISHDYWVQARASDPDVLGTTLRYNEISYTVVGVAPDDFDFPRGTQAWSTLRAGFPEWTDEAPVQLELDLVGRLAAGQTTGSAFLSVDRLLDDPALGSQFDDLDVSGAPFTEVVIGSLDAVLKAALVAAAVVLLVAIANATLLFLAGGMRVVREAAMRRALGASGARVVAPLVADAALQSVLAVVFALVLSQVVFVGLVPLAPDDFVRFDEVALDPVAFGVAVLLGAVAMLGSAGVAGSWVARRDPRDVLVSGGRSVAGGGAGLRGSIAGGQMALAVLASVGAALLWQTVSNLDALDRGFDPDGLHVVTLTLPFSFVEMPPEYPAALADVAEALEARPGIVGVSPTMNAPLSLRAGIDFTPMLEGQSEEDTRSNPFIGFDAVLPQFFDVMGTEIVRGRGPEPADGPDDDPVIVVNESAAALLWPGQEPVGQQVFMGLLSREEWRTVVGVVADHRIRSFPEVRPAAYLPLAQYDRFGPSRLMVRAESPDGLRRLISEEFDRFFPGVEVLTIEPMVELMRRPLLRPRFAASVLLAFAAVTMLLAALGVHGVFSVLVHERTRDLGVRIALGAAAWDVVRFMGMRVLAVGASGAAVGAALSLSASGVVDSLVFGIAPRDSTTVIAVVCTTVAVGILAGALPTLRAVRTDPVVSLRAE